MECARDSPARGTAAIETMNEAGIRFAACGGAQMQPEQDPTVNALSKSRGLGPLEFKCWSPEGRFSTPDRFDLGARMAVRKAGLLADKAGVLNSSTEPLMDLTAVLLAALVVLPAAGLTAWAWFAMAQDEEELRALSGLHKHHGGA